MKTKISIAVGLLWLTGCADVENETRSTIIVDGSSYELRTQTVNGPKGPYKRSSVIVKNRLYVCLPNSPGDCEAAVRLARSEYNRD